MNMPFCTARSFAWWAFLLLLSGACANKVAPSGGAKDITPPEIVAAEPENHSVNMTGLEIRVDFDEYIRLADLQKQLIISPLISPDPEITATKKSLFIRFDRPLRPNTTYTLQFGDAIVDVHEGNAVPDFKYIFSTGPFLDSMSVSGQARFANNLETEKGILVMLYHAGRDTAVLAAPPDYFTRTDAAGQFRLGYLAAGTYRIAGLKDANANYIADQPEEEIAFSDTLVSTSDTLPVLLRLFRPGAGTLRLLQAVTEEPGKLRAVFNTGYRDVTAIATGPDPKPWSFEEFSAARDTAWLWVTDPGPDSLEVVFYENDIPFDTARFVARKKPGKRTGNVAVPALTSNLNGNFLEAGSGLVFSSSRPVRAFHPEHIEFMVDSVTEEGLVADLDDTLRRKISVGWNWNEHALYRIAFLPGALEDFAGAVNDTTRFSFRLRPASAYGSLLLKVKTDSLAAPYILQLVTGSSVIRRRVVTGPAELSYEFLPPGAYRFKAIVDGNRNGRWDTGNFPGRIQPETVRYYPDTVTIRANWDLELEWNLDPAARE